MFGSGRTGWEFARPAGTTLDVGAASTLHAIAMNTNTPASAPAIEVAGLRKSFGDNDVLTGIDFTVGCGSVYALLIRAGTGSG